MSVNSVTVHLVSSEMCGYRCTEQVIFSAYLSIIFLSLSLFDVINDTICTPPVTSPAMYSNRSEGVAMFSSVR